MQIGDPEVPLKAQWRRVSVSADSTTVEQRTACELSCAKCGDELGLMIPALPEPTSPQGMIFTRPGYVKGVEPHSFVPSRRLSRQQGEAQTGFSERLPGYSRTRRPTMFNSVEDWLQVFAPLSHPAGHELPHQRDQVGRDHNVVQIVCLRCGRANNADRREIIAALDAQAGTEHQTNGVAY